MNVHEMVILTSIEWEEQVELEIKMEKLLL